MNAPYPLIETPSPVTADPAASWLDWWPVAVAAVLALVVLVLVAVLIRRLWRKATPVSATDAGVAPAKRTRRPRRSRDEIMDTVRTTAAPIVLGAVVLWLVFDGLAAFAVDSMGLLPPMSYAVIIAFEFVALWLCWERFARAQAGRPDVPGLAVGQWALLGLAMLFQYDHAQHDELSIMGTVARVALPAILGGVVEWALHSRRTTVRNRDDQDRGRLFDHSLRSNPWLFVRSRYVLAAHADWTAEQAVQHVRTQDAKNRALRLRDVLNNPPGPPAEPAPVAEPDQPFGVAGAGERERARLQRDHERAQSRAEATRSRRARDYGRAQARYRRALAAHQRRATRLRNRLVRTLDALGFAGQPTDAPAADMLRAVQVGVLADDLATLDYSDTRAAREFFAGLITAEDLTAARVDGPAPASTPDRGPGSEIHVDPTPASTPDPHGRVDQGSVRVDGRVDASAANPAPAAPADGAPAVSSAPDQGPRVDRVDEGRESAPAGVDVHTGSMWPAPNGHTPAPRAGGDTGPDRVDENAAAPGAAGTDGDDQDPDDDPDGPRGGGAPAPAQGGVAAGQVTVDEALVSQYSPEALGVARVGLGAPAWDEARTKKDQVMALLWEHAGDVTAVRSAWYARTGTEVPRDLYRSGPRGYAYRWHYDVAYYLISEYAHADTVRMFLAAAGVDYTHEAVTVALDEWQYTHGDRVVQFRRVPSGP